MDQLGVAVIISLIGGFAMGGLVYVTTKKSFSSTPRRAVVMGIIVFILVLAAQASIDSAVQVQVGTVAVVKQFERVITTFEPGLNFKMPFVQEVVVYRTQEIIYEASADPHNSNADYPDSGVDTATADGQQIRAHLTIRFRIDGQQVDLILTNLGTEREMVVKVVKANARVRVRNGLRRFQSADLYNGDWTAAEAAITEVLRADFARESIELLSFEINSIQFAEDVENAIKE